MKQNSAANEYVRETVIEACEMCRAKIEKLRREETDGLYAYLMKPRRKYGFWGKLVTRTMEEAKQAADRYDVYAAEGMYFGQYEEAKLILRAAQNSCGDYFWLTKEEFHNIDGFYEKAQAQ